MLLTLIDLNRIHGMGIEWLDLLFQSWFCHSYLHWVVQLSLLGYFTYFLFNCSFTCVSRTVKLVMLYVASGMPVQFRQSQWAYNLGKQVYTSFFFCFPTGKVRFIFFFYSVPFSYFFYVTFYIFSLRLSIFGERDWLLSLCILSVEHNGTLILVGVFCTTAVQIIELEWK